jgi:putative flippase GtrA
MKTHIQFARYVIVGIVSNAVIYVVYIALTRIGVGPKLAMSLLYGVGVLQTFVFNKKWSFRFQGAATPALIRYAIVYIIGYFANLFALMLLVDLAGLPHQLIQGIMIFVIAIFLFLAQKYFVFSLETICNSK